MDYRSHYPITGVGPPRGDVGCGIVSHNTGMFPKDHTKISIVLKMLRDEAEVSEVNNSSSYKIRQVLDTLPREGWKFPL